jgi:hypothetical protein
MKGWWRESQRVERVLVVEPFVYLRFATVVVGAGDNEMYITAVVLSSEKAKNASFIRLRLPRDWCRDGVTRDP